MRLRLPREHPATPPTGYKIAYPVLSHDGTRAGFTGVSLGGGSPYGVLADARCVYGRRHAAPARRCDCGFHCLHSLTETLGLTCVGAHRRAVVLEVSVLGSYIRYERGMRYARQRVRAVRVGPCGCGRAATRFADAGWGRPGWRAVAADCGGCALGHAGWTFGEFGELAGGELTITAQEGTGGREPDASAVTELMAEAALLQARLDWFQGRLAKVAGQGYRDSEL
ncbi:hypothetical protein [Streptomyces griseocarneus]|uniref:hypothetical protein n=1 Tax=Streptomyces griseocarneus TaxID=51201 RepID=UPI00167F1CCB|nr:hypothetical protein [Streptomyces griseocarneus]MBZ6471831.1 hypothetical protein [Streptomyces griseocarneus]GHG71096.1 hypothetical protein GCM10018779_45510 [Streptomyces griseocarneus]